MAEPRFVATIFGPEVTIRCGYCHQTMIVEECAPSALPDGRREMRFECEHCHQPMRIVFSIEDTATRGGDAWPSP